jgi:hypothetical protein
LEASVGSGRIVEVWVRSRLALLASSLLVSTNLCLFGTYEIYASNRTEFDVTYGDVLPVLIGFTLALAAVLTLAGLLLRGRFRSVFTSILLALGGLLWLQGSFLRWGYGEFSGTAIDWAAFPWQGWVDAAVWLAVLAAAVRFHGRLSRNALFIAVVCMLLQAGAVTVRAVADSSNSAGTAGSGRAGESYSEVPQALCRLSSTKNVFHILMDGFQTDIFMDVVAEDHLAESLDGFTLYTDNMSAGGRTVLSVPSVFSTNVYDGTQSESAYFRKAAAGSFNFILYQNGYVVNLMPHITMEGTPYTNYYVRPDAYAVPHFNRIMRASTYLADLSMFRQFPHYLKRVVYNDQNWRLASLVGEPPNQLSFHHKAFFRDYTNRLEVGFTEPAYHFMHLMPPHPPFVTLADGTYAGKALPYTRENFKNEARDVLRLFIRFLDRLKSLGLYDSSIILLHADHGGDMPPRIEGKKTTVRMGKVSALLALKPAFAHGPLRTSSAQTSLTDIPATIMGLLGLEHPYPGTPITQIDESIDRDRRVVFVTDRSSAEPTVHRWVVRGSAYDSLSWHELKPVKLEKKIGDYQWGTLVRFGIAGNGEGYLTKGWSTTSPTVHWNDSDTAEMVFGIPEPERDVEFKITFFPHIVPGKVDRQRFRVYVNGQFLDEVVCTKKYAQNIGTVLPRELLKGGRAVFSFEFLDAVSPREIGEGRDSRKLAMGLFRFEMSLVPEKEVPDDRR